jgi:hypothetical protein
LGLLISLSIFIFESRSEVQTHIPVPPLDIPTAILIMSSNRSTITLDSEVMGKLGRRYTVSEITTILLSYNVLPLAEGRRGEKLLVFQQLHQLARDRDLTRDDRLRVMRNADRNGRVYMQRRSARRILTQAEQDSANLSQTKPMTQVAEKAAACSVCLEEHPLGSFPPTKITLGCQHEPTICFGCLTQAIDSQIGDRAWDAVSCPMCPERLTFEVIRKYSSPASFERHVGLSFIRNIISDIV